MNASMTARKITLDLWTKLLKPTIVEIAQATQELFDDVGYRWSWVIFAIVMSYCETAIAMASVAYFVNARLAPIGMVAVLLLSCLIGPIYWIHQYRADRQMEILIDLQERLKHLENIVKSL